MLHGDMRAGAAQLAGPEHPGVHRQDAAGADVIFRRQARALWYRSVLVPGVAAVWVLCGDGARLEGRRPGLSVLPLVVSLI